MDLYCKLGPYHRCFEPLLPVILLSLHCVYDHYHHLGEDNDKLKKELRALREEEEKLKGKEKNVKWLF